MEYRFLGSSGLRVSALSFGSWVTFGTQFGEETAHDCMKAAFDAGVNFFDNAEGYAGGQSETIMGSVVKKAGWKRSDLVVSTKIFWGGRGPNDSGLSRKHIIEGTNAALAGLAQNASTSDSARRAEFSLMVLLTSFISASCLTCD